MINERMPLWLSDTWERAGRYVWAVIAAGFVVGAAWAQTNSNIGDLQQQNLQRKAEIKAINDNHTLFLSDWQKWRESVSTELGAQHQWRQTTADQLNRIETAVIGKG